MKVPLIRQDESGHYTVDGCYRAGTLTKTMTMDEDEVTTIEYKDLSGLTVMRRTVLDDEYADTYYVYDGNKRAELVLTPDGNDPRTCRRSHRQFLHCTSLLQVQL